MDGEDIDAYFKGELKILKVDRLKPHIHWHCTTNLIHGVGTKLTYLCQEETNCFRHMATEHGTNLL
jgi:hypothetical protein